MSGYDPRALPSKRDRLVWRQKLIETSRYASCFSQHCHLWDKYFNSFDYPVLAERRRIDQTNYSVWIPAYCESLGVEEHHALLTLEQHHCCIPCLGRILYQTLCSEFWLNIHAKRTLKIFENLLISRRISGNPKPALKGTGRTLFSTWRLKG